MRRMFRRMLGLYSSPLLLGVTTPTSLINRLMGLESCPDGMQIAAALPVIVPAATTALTLTPTLHAGKTLLLASTGGLAITPPPATGTFNIYTFAVITTISGGSVTIDPKAGAAADVCGGAAFCGSSGGTAGTFGTAANSNLITLNATTTGGLLGTFIEMIDVKLNAWLVFISNVCSGTAATPFSNH